MGFNRIVLGWAFTSLLALVNSTSIHAQNCTPQWSDKFPNSVDGIVGTLYTWNDGPQGPRLIAAGSFSAIEGVPGGNIMQFDGTRWSALGIKPVEFTSVGCVTSCDCTGDGFSELYVAGTFSGIGAPAPAGVARWDGSQWSMIGAPFQEGSLYELAAFDDGNGPRLYAAGHNLVLPTGVLTSVAVFDGTQWTNVHEGVTGTIHGLFSSRDPLSGKPVLYVAGGGMSSAPGFVVNELATWDGETFRNIEGAPNNIEELALFQDELYVDGQLSSASTLPATSMARWDGKNWSPVPGLGQSVSDIVAMQVFDDGGGEGAALYVKGGFHTAGGLQVGGLARWNGETWSQLGDLQGLNELWLGQTMAAFPADGAPSLWVGGDLLHTWNGTQWRSRNHGISGVGVGAYGETYVYAMRWFDDRSGHGERLFVGGDFSLAGPMRTNAIAAWDGNAWSTLGAGLDRSLVYSLEVFDAGDGPSLFAGRSTWAIGRSPLVKWNGQQWSEIKCPGDNVLAMTVLPTSNGERLAIAANSGSQSSVMLWDGNVFTALGEPFNDRILGLGICDFGTGPSLVAGGTFTASGNTALNRIARWNGEAWEPLGSGLSSVGSGTYARGITMFDAGDGQPPKLIVGGYFNTAGGVPCQSIAAWDGTNWSALDAGIGGQVNALKAVREGHDNREILYVGGYFYYAGGALQANSLARWNGVFWEPLGNGGVEGAGYQFSTVEVLESHTTAQGVEVIAGGHFRKAGGLSAANITSWRGCEPQPSTYPVCRYEVIPLSTDEGLANDLYARDLTNTTVTLTSHLGSGGNPDALYTWSEAKGLEPVVLPAGGTRPYAAAINNLGNFAAGVTFEYGGKACINIGGQWSIIPGLAHEGYSAVHAMNNDNVAVGVRGPGTNSSSDEQGFIWQDRTITPLTHPEAVVMRPSDINDNGDIIGRYRTHKGEKLFLWSKGALTTLPLLPAATEFSANAINAHRDIAGFIWLSNTIVPVIWQMTDRSTITQLGTLPGYPRGLAYDINIHRDVVGKASDYNPAGPDLPDRALLWRNGEIIDLNEHIPANVYIYLYAAYAINDAGEILCDGGMPVILRPIPPSPADLNGDCSVDLNDVLIVLHEWGESNSPADVNLDGIVDVDDLLLVIAEWR